MRPTWKLVAGCVLLACFAAPAFAASNRIVANGVFAIELDGKFAGQSTQISGGFAVGNVVKDPIAIGGPFYVKKHLEDPPGYKEIGIRFNTGMSAAFYQAITNALNGQGTSHNGSITLLNNRTPVRRLDFFNAFITELTIPSADASSRDGAWFEVVLSPASTIESKKAAAPKSVSCTVKDALASSFRFDIGGVALNGHVASVGQLVIHIPPGTNRSNDACVECPPSVVIDFPDVDVTMPDAFAQPLFDWYDDFVAKGNNADSQEKTGTLDFMTSNFQTMLFEINFAHLGITEAAHPSNTRDSVQTASAHMYAEAISFQALSAAACN